MGKLARNQYLVILLLLGVTFGAFYRVLGGEFLRYDDDVYITLNPFVKAGLSRVGLIWAFATGYNANWHPLTWVSHMLDVEVFGMNAGGHHLTNLILHLANTMLLFLVLRRMTGFVWRSAFVAALFGVHPLHVESVAWIAERKDVLSTLFWLLTIWAYARYAENPTWTRYLPVVLFFGLGLMAKPMLVTLPFVLLLLDYWPLNRLSFGGKGERTVPVYDLFLEKVPLFAMTALSCLITFRAQQMGGAVGLLEKLPFAVRAGNALVAYTTYIGKMFWPKNLAVFYPHPGADLPVWQAVVAGLALVSITILVIRAGKPRPYLSVGWLWYLGTLVPVIGLVQVGAQAMADRYTYVPMIGLFIMLAWGLPGLGGKRLAVPATLVVCALIAVTWRQVGYWRDSISLFRHAISVTEKNAVMHANLGLALRDRGRTDEAIREYREAIRIDPEFAQAHNNLAVALYFKGDYAEAWKEVHLAGQYGVIPNQSFLDALSEKMPDPEW